MRRGGIENFTVISHDAPAQCVLVELKLPRPLFIPHLFMSVGSVTLPPSYQLHFVDWSKAFWVSAFIMIQRQSEPVSCLDAPPPVTSLLGSDC